ncbi:hypothetical protein [Streptomyces flaveus]|jgi:hypothetical protein
MINLIRTALEGNADDLRTFSKGPLSDDDDDDAEKKFEQEAYGAEDSVNA